MNRYTQLTPSQFNPLSLEEVMLVPSMKRKQHDDILAKQEILRGELSKVDPLDVHLDEAVKLREQMNNKLTAQAEQLAKSGIDPNSQGQFLALNREYQNLTGPTGRIGQINNAKKVYYDNMNSYIKDATENKKWSREKALENWQKNMHNKYKGYDDENKTNIVNIGQYGAPDKIETMVELKKVKDILGDQVVSEIFNGGNYVRERADGNGYEVINKNGSRVVTSNDPNIQQALGLIQSRILDPQGDIRKSAEFEGKDINKLWQEYQFGAKAMLSNKISDDRNTSLSLDAVKNQGEWNEMNAVGELIETTSSFLPNEFAVNNYNKNQSTLNNLLQKQKTGKLSKEENIELNKLQNFQTTLNNTLKTDKIFNEYSEYDNKAKEVAKKAGISSPYAHLTTGVMSDGGRFTFEKTADGKYQQYQYSGSSKYGQTKNKVGKPITASEKTIIDKGFEFNKKMNERRNELTKENSVMTTGYNMLPTTPKEEGLYKTFNNSFEQVLKNPEALRKYMNIETVDVDGQSVKPSTKDKDKLAQLYQEYGNNLKVTNMIPKDFNGQPGYVIEFNTGEEDYNMDGLGKGSVGGKDKTVRMKVTFNKEHGNVLGNINHYGLKYFEGKGQINPQTGKPIGQDLANEARKNMYSNTTFNDVLNDPTYNWQNDEIVKNNMYKTIKKDLTEKGKRSVYSGVSDMNLLQQIFRDHNGDDLITK